MPYFTAPVRDTLPTVGYDRGVPRLANELFQHYANRPEGWNVYKWADGTISEREPAEGIDTIETIWYGGHVAVYVNEDDAAALTAAGYEVTPDG